MSECPYKNFKSKIAKFIGVLQEPREESEGLQPVLLLVLKLIKTC